MSKTDTSQLHQDLKQALETVRMFERRTAKLMAQNAEPIAIISMACRLPGGTNSPESYWELLEQGRDVVGDFPERWQDLDIYDPDPSAVGKTYARAGGFLDAIEEFDAQFFGIAPREAQAMDPQQRVVLETAWEALERAGVQQDTLSESKTGVYLGAIASEYSSLNVQGLEGLDGYQLTSNMMSVASGRLAYVLGLHGPALTVDTACSSSLVALHLASTALRRRECDMALAGGVGLIVTPAVFVEFSRLRAMSPDGRCKSFSARADGAGWAEGCGMLVLKRLSDAQRDGDRVWAVVRGSAVNQDGRSQGLTAPNGPAQQRVIRDALTACRLSPQDIDAVEAHGTGTALGDPVEAGALLEVFGAERDPEHPLYLGSSKSNLGHTAAAAGIVGVIKMVLSLYNERLPRTLHVDEPTPHIPWEGSGLALLQEAREWKRNGRARRAGVSAFGISGTNAHVVLEEAPLPAAEQAASEGTAGSYPLVISGRDEGALRAQAAQLARWLAAHPEARLADVVHTLALHRTHFDVRAGIGAGSAAEAIEGLQALADGERHAAVVQGQPKAGGKVVFVFPGQGSQWAGMGRALLEESEVFAKAVQACDAALSPWTGWSVLALLRGDSSSELLPAWDRVDAVQPALFAMGVGLSAVWRSLGVEPAAVVGHSQGEVTAAVVSGALTLEDGARVVALRSQAVRRRSGDGAMLLIERPVAEVERLIAKYGEALSIAAVNTESSTVVSGDAASVDALMATLQTQSLFCRKVNVDYASHSAQMDELLPELREQLAGLAPRAGQVPLYSTVLAQRLSGEELNADYWCRNLRQTVRLDKALAQLQEDGHGVFVEVSAHPVLTMTLSGACDAQGAVVVGSLQRERGALNQLQRGLAELHVHGQRVDWKRLLTAVGGRMIDLPTYAFQRQRFWVEAAGARKDARALGLTSSKHPLLGALTALADSDGYLFSGLLSLSEQAWLRDHAVHGTVLMPGTGMLELALHAARAVGLATVLELTLEQPLILGEGAGLALQLSVGALDEAGQRSVGIYSRAGDGAWQRHAVGLLGRGHEEVRDAGFDELRAWPVADGEVVALDGLYPALHAQGLQYGPMFQGLCELRRADQVAYARVALPESGRAAAEHYGLHPALLDAALHSLIAFSAAEGIELPFAWTDVQLYAAGASELRVRVELAAGEAGQRTATLWVADGLGEPVARIGGLHVRPLRVEQLQVSQRRNVEHFYRLAFQPVALGARDELAQVVIGGDGQLAALLGAAWHADLPAYLQGLTAAAGAERIVIDATPQPESVSSPLWSAAEAAAARALALVQTWLSDERLQHSQLVWVTSGAVAGTPAPVEDLVHAPVWGMMRAARNEHPDRVLRLVDLGGARDAELLAGALAAKHEPELALHEGSAYAPRLARVLADEQLAPPQLSGSVLITGGTGELGAELAQHLVRAYGVKHLWLTSRQGAQAPGAQALRETLQSLGAERVQVVACDVTDREQLVQLFAGLAHEPPLCAVFHLSGVLDDGLIEAQTAERLSPVFAPKVAGALHLAELTRDHALAAFVLYSSASGTLGGVGQSNYAAANTLLDALAAQRRQRGLPGTSLAWGLWQPSGVGLTGKLRQADLARMARQGIAALSVAEGLQLIDAGLCSAQPHVLAIRLELGQLQRAAEQGVTMPALMRGLVRGGLRRASAAAADASALRERLSGLAEPERLDALVSMVCGEVAGVLGLPNAQAVDPDKELQKLGLDSLMAVEVRNRLAARAATRLPATLAFDYPTPRAIAKLLLKQAFGEQDVARTRTRAQKRAERDEPIAIIAMACRLPGGIDTPEAYWDLLSRGGDAVGPFPARWSSMDVYDPDPDAAGKSYVREGGFVEGVELFDADFFGTSAREVRRMDPQQRLVLETAWEALERAGIRPSELNESATGVYVGCLGSDYAAAQGMSYEAMDGYFTTGVATSVLSGRLAYVLGLQGPAMTIDTACSSSLVSLHLACNALRHGECDLAMVGGVTVMTTPSIFIEFSRLRGLAPDGRCKSFSGQADGAGWAEGCGMLVVKRLSDARRDGDRVLALVRGSAVNQDGRSQGLTAPNGPSQVRVIRDALHASRLTQQDIDAVEAHGTGTALGDPIEAGALLEVFGQGREPERPLYLGSSKSNLGHTQAAAGIVGVIKMVLSMQHDLLPKTLHAEQPTPHVDWQVGGVSLLQQPQVWKRSGRVRRAGISAFGVSGTNAHVVIEEAPASPPRAAAPEPSSAVWPLLISGRDEQALRAQSARLASWLGAHPDARIADVAHTLALHRMHFDARAGVSASSAAEAIEGLNALARGEGHAALVQARCKPGGKVVFVFPGQGSQWAAMGRALLEQSEVFTSAVEACDVALSPWTGWSVAALLRGDSSSELPAWERVDAVQPALFAMGVGLAALWRSFGVEPAAVVGHSQGEVTAAVVSGALSLEDAARVVALRSQAVRRRSGDGAMLLIERPLEEVEGLIAKYGPALSIAAVNTASSTVVSGEAAAVDALIEELKEQSLFCRKVNVDYASHSAQMDVLLPELREQLSSLCPRAGSIPLYSTVTAQRESGEALDGEYWCRNLRRTVRLDKALAQLLEDGHGVFIEISAHPVLTMTLSGACDAKGAVVVGSLQRERGSLAQLQRALLELHVQGHAVDWKRRLAPAGGQVIELPTYAFQRERHWFDLSASFKDAQALGLSAVQHPLLGALTALADSDGYVFSTRLSLAEHAWLKDHAAHGTVLMPGTGMVELALHAARAVGLSVVAELTLEQPLILPEGAGTQLQLSVGNLDDAGRRTLSIFSRAGDSAWVRNASGLLGAAAPTPSGSAQFDELRSWSLTGTERVELSGFYDRLRAQGLEYGPAFQGLVELHHNGSTAYSRVVLPEALRSSTPHYGVHPALLDAALHGLLALGMNRGFEGLCLPFSWSQVQLHATGASELRVRTELVKLDSEAPETPQNMSVSLYVADGIGEPVASVEALRVRPLQQRLQAPRPRAQENLFRIEFQPLALPEPGEAVAQVVVAGDGRLSELLGATWYASLDGLFAQLEAADVPRRIVIDATTMRETDERVPALQHESARALGLLQRCLADERLQTCEFVWVTAAAVSCGPDWPVDEVVQAALWGMLRAARNEHPDRVLRLVDVGRERAGLDAALLQQALALADEPELALRSGVALAARMCPAGRDELATPASAAWRLMLRETGRLDAFELVPAAEASLPLGANEVRVSVRASGLNFRDVMTALGLVPDGLLGIECAGVVLEVGAAVSSMRVGERVMGLAYGSFGNEVRADVRMLVQIPQDLSFAQAATVPAVYLTAMYALEDLGRLRAGDKLLIHAATGGVGMAAIQLARAAGAEVFATASESKWPVLRGLGLDDAHIASSRNLDFERKWLEYTLGFGVDVVLNSLAGEYVDASLRLLPRGGWFLEMGKTDIRSESEVAAQHDGVQYRAFDLMAAAGIDRVGELLVKLAGLLRDGVVQPLPFTAYDLRQASSAFRFMAQAKHVGKIVLQVPRSLSSHGAVLITGGTGELGAELAQHLVRAHGAKHLVLTSRRGREAPGAQELVERLLGLGAESVDVVACDVSQRADVARLVAQIERERALTGVFHLSAVLDDGLLAAQTPERLAAVLGPKLAGALHLDELTRDRDLDAFVLFSSAAGTLGNAGQSNYAAANAGLDALAAQRRKRGLTGTSLAWGLWQPSGTGLTAKLGPAELARMARQGIAPLSTQDGMQLMDAALLSSEAHLVPMRLQLGQLQRVYEQLGTPPAIMRALLKPGLRKASAREASALRERLSSLPEAERLDALIRLVQTEVASVLGLAGPSVVDPDKELQKLGLDSLMAVELRNRLSTQAATTLPATLAFDYPTPRAIARLLLKQAFGELAKQPAARRSERRADQDEPIAIISMACRLPGGVDNPERYWEVLEQGRDVVGGFPERWQGLDIYDPDPDAVGKTYAREGGFLDSIEAFDAQFFGIAPREAQAMDPQQRVILETVWEALERAGIQQGSLSESATGVYLGAIASEYGSLKLNGLDGLDGYQLTSNMMSVVSGRVSYVLGLQGPALTVDTACSSSLVALHLACTALRRGECDMALAGGVSLIVTPALFVEFSRLRAMSPDGRCKSFSSTADGAGWAEGCGILVLKRLSDAQRDGDRVCAVVRGSAVNQDGRSQGLTAPNGPAQQRVIREALHASRLGPQDIDAVEAHGTGTPLGDPIEAGALLEVFGNERDPERPLLLGSSKSNLGHTAAAAGVVGVMKMVLALQHELLPKTLHVEQPTPHIPWGTSGLSLLQEPRAWKRNGRPRRAGVSSFGVSGTNVHVVIEEAPKAVSSQLSAAAQAAGSLPVTALAVSGRDQAALRAQAKQLVRWLAGHADAELPAVARTLALHRTHFAARAVVLADDVDQAIAGLDALAAGQVHPAVFEGNLQESGKLAVLFTGQGSQRTGMGKELYACSPVFRRSFDAVSAALAPQLGLAIEQVMFEPDERLDQTEYAQPALFALEVALYRLWESWGLKPDVLAGHSVGEISAAHLAGVLSLADAAKLVAARARLMQQCRHDGAMVSVEASEAEVLAELGAFPGVEIAGINAPEQTVLSGDEAAVLALAQLFAARGRRTRRLKVSHAFHSAHMQSMLEPFAEVARSCSYAPAQLTLMSLLTGKPAQPGDFSTPEYWVRQVREGVRFSDGIQALEAQGVRSYLECGPDGVLSGMATQCASERARCMASLRAGRAELRTLAAALAALHVQGQRLDWQHVLGGSAGGMLELPTYAFQRERYWHDSKLGMHAPTTPLDDDSRQLWDALRSGNPARVAALLDVPEAERDQLAPLLQQLADWDERRKSDERVGSCLYAASWRPLSQPRVAANLSGSSWLLIAPPTQPCEDLARALEAKGAQLLRQPAVDSGVTTALRQVHGVLLPVAPTATGEAEPSALLGTLRALAALRQQAPKVPVWLITRAAAQSGEAHTLNGRDTAYARGLTRSLAAESPQLRVLTLELPPSLDDAAQAQLANSLAAEPIDRELWLSAEGRSARRLVRVTPSRSARVTARDTVLITGELSGLGVQLARWLAERGARQVVLAARLALEESALSELRAALEGQGVQLSFVSCDVSRRDRVEWLLAQLRAAEFPLRAVYHISASAQEPVWHTQGGEAAREHLHLHAQPAGLLHELTAELALDAFVMLAPLSGALGETQQLGAALSFAEFERLASQRRARGLPGLCVATTLPEPVDPGSAFGTRSLPPRLLLRGLELALQSDAPSIVLADFDWQRVAALVDAGRFDRLFDTLDEITRRPQGSQAIDTGWLSDADPSTHAELILERLKTYTAVALEGRQPDAHTNLFQLGMDSLMTLDLVRWVRRTTGVTMEPRSLVLFPTLGALSAQLAKLFATRATPADAAATGARVQHAAPRRQEHRVVIEGAEHCVSSWGEPSARPVLCLHGYNDQGPIWQEVARALVGRGRYVIAPDLKGHGLSARSPHARGSDLADFTRDIGAICDALELREITLVGHSLGTLIAVALAAHQPERLAGLCLVEPISPPLEAPRASTSADGAVPVRKHRPFANEAEALQVFEAFHPNMPSALRTELVQRVLVREGERLVWRTDPYAVASSNWTYRKEYLAQLHKIAVQSAIVLGENSEITRDDELVSALPNARVVSVSGGHWIHYEQPERLAEVIDLLGKLGSS